MRMLMFRSKLQSHSRRSSKAFWGRGRRTHHPTQ